MLRINPDTSVEKINEVLRINPDSTITKIKGYTSSSTNDYIIQSNDFFKEYVKSDGEITKKIMGGMKRTYKNSRNASIDVSNHLLSMVIQSAGQ